MSRPFAYPPKSIRKDRNMMLTIPVFVVICIGVGLISAMFGGAYSRIGGEDRYLRFAAGSFAFGFLIMAIILGMLHATMVLEPGVC